MNNVLHDFPSKLSSATILIILMVMCICLFALSEQRFFPMTKAHLYQNIGYYSGFGEQQKPEFNIEQVSKIDFAFGKYRILHTPSNYYRVVRQLSEIPEADDYKIRQISLSDSLLLKTSVMVKLMNGIDLDGTPVDIKNKSITLVGN